ncbi:MAG: YfiT family bacillithiol transferase, partial [Bacteroidota bacterium]
MDHLRYPIGTYKQPLVIKADKIEQWIAEIAVQPAKYRTLIDNLSEEALNLTYRPGGWTIRQVIHHVVDSHMNSFIRFKWALTEDNPTIKAYHEDRWATLEDYDQTPVVVSLKLLEALHQRWVILLKSLTPAQLKRTFVHPESGATIPLDALIGMYAWHGN